MTYNAIIIGSRQQASRSGAENWSAVAPATQRRSIPRRIPNEFYPTPPAAVRALLSVEEFDGTIWEPACGEGAISNALSAAGHEVISTDRFAYGFGESSVDFLKETRPRGRHVVTNPPYGRGLADRFILKALSLTQATDGKVAMLLNLASLCHPLRTRFWRRHQPARIYAIDSVVCWPEHRYGRAPEDFTRHRYCWVVWDPDHQGETAFGWLSADAFRE